MYLRICAVHCNILPVYSTIKFVKQLSVFYSLRLRMKLDNVCLFGTCGSPLYINSCARKQLIHL